MNHGNIPCYGRTSTMISKMWQNVALLFFPIFQIKSQIKVVDWMDGDKVMAMKKITETFTDLGNLLIIDNDPLSNDDNNDKYKFSLFIFCLIVWNFECKLAYIKWKNLLNSYKISDFLFGSSVIWSYGLRAKMWLLH